MWGSGISVGMAGLQAWAAPMVPGAVVSVEEVASDNWGVGASN